MEEIKSAVEFVRTASPLRPSIGVVLGSGLGVFAETLEHAVHIPYRNIPAFPVSTAVGHASELVLGKVGANGTTTTEIAVLSGRFHLYEGYSARQVVSGIRLFRDLGVRTVVLTCAAGGLNPEFAEGALVAISDHINLQAANPLVGPNDERLGPRFPDMTEAYSKQLRDVAIETARELGITLHEGVYAAMLGPSYETPAEIRFLKTIGADLVGMSTVAECIAANHMSMKVLGIACVTNLAAGLGPGKLMHSEVLAITRKVSGTFLQLLGSLIPKLANS
jgi:purine-nucleoside phosphorylase